MYISEYVILRVSKNYKNNVIVNNIFSKFGSSVVFYGMVRKFNVSKIVKFIEYNIFEKLIYSMLVKYCLFLVRNSNPCRVYIYQYNGIARVRDINIVISVVSVNRKQSFILCKDLIEFIKINIPIWKREYYMDNTYYWIRTF